jgi:hypothetical protein
LANLLQAPKTLRSQLVLHQLLEQLLFSQQLSWQEPSSQVLRHQRKVQQLS